MHGTVNTSGFPNFILSMPNNRPLSQDLISKLEAKKSLNRYSQGSPLAFGKSNISQIKPEEEFKKDKELDLQDISLVFDENFPQVSQAKTMQ